MKPQAVSFLQIISFNYAFQHLSFHFQKPTSPPSSSSLYRVNSTNGNTCILMRTDALLSIQYRDKLNEDKEADVYLPDYPGLTGKPRPASCNK